MFTDSHKINNYLQAIEVAAEVLYHSIPAQKRHEVKNHYLLISDRVDFIMSSLEYKL